MKVAVIVQARMGSTRLPGKILRPILEKPMLALHLERLRRTRNVHQVVVATTTSAADDPIVALCEEHGVMTFRGSETHVLERYYQAAQQVAADAVIRICSDSPLTDPLFLEALVDFYTISFPPYDLAHSGKGFSLGLGAEIFSFAALQAAYQHAMMPEEHEHVTPYLYRHPERFRVGTFEGENDCAGHRLTVDTPEDFEVIRSIFEQLYPGNPQFTYQDVMALLARQPELSRSNAHVRQKRVGE